MLVKWKGEPWEGFKQGKEGGGRRQCYQKNIDSNHWTTTTGPQQPLPCPYFASETITASHVHSGLYILWNHSAIVLSIWETRVLWLQVVEWVAHYPRQYVGRPGMQTQARLIPKSLNFPLCQEAKPWTHPVLLLFTRSRIMWMLST